MMISYVLLLISFMYPTFAQGCKYIRYETPAEAERRAIFERCLVSCSESSTDSNPCYDCMVPYKAYGCLLKKEQLLGCDSECAVQKDIELFALCRLRCAQKRRMLKKLGGYKKLQNL